MKNIALTALVAALLLFCPQRARCALDGEIENIIFRAESDEGAGLAEKETKLIIAHGLGRYFKNVFVIENKNDDNLSPIMILQLNSEGHSLQLEKNEKIDKMLDEATFLMANLFKDQKVEIWVQDNDYDNLLKAVYDPGDNKVNKKLIGSDAQQQQPESEASGTAGPDTETAERSEEIDVELSSNAGSVPWAPDDALTEKVLEAE